MDAASTLKRRCASTRRKGATTQKTAIYILAAMRTLKLTDAVVHHKIYYLFHLNGKNTRVFRTKYHIVQNVILHMLTYH